MKAANQAPESPLLPMGLLGRCCDESDTRVKACFRFYAALGFIDGACRDGC